MVDVAVWVFVEDGVTVAVAALVAEGCGVSVTVELIGELVDPESALQPDKPYAARIINKAQVKILFDLSRRFPTLSSNVIH
jgi:hypothetical protein